MPTAGQRCPRIHPSQVRAVRRDRRPLQGVLAQATDAVEVEGDVELSSHEDAHLRLGDLPPEPLTDR